MILNDLIPLPIDCAKEAVNDFHLHFDNRVDGVENEVGYVMNERSSNPAGLDTSLVFNKVNSSLRHRHSIWWNTLRNRH